MRRSAPIFPSNASVATALEPISCFTTYPLHNGVSLSNPLLDALLHDTIGKASVVTKTFEILNE